MPVVAAHMLLYTPEADAVRAVFRDVFGWAHVEDHPGWLIFAMPPSELGIHPSEGSTKHEICLMCDDLEATMQATHRVVGKMRIGRVSLNAHNGDLAGD